MNIYGALPKRIFLVLASIFLGYQSYSILVMLPKIETLGTSGQVGLAFYINLCVLGAFAFAGFALPTEKLLPDSYYTIRDAKKVKFWYKKLGVENFRKFLLATVWKNKERHSKFFNGKVSGIEVFETQTRKSEFGHLIPFFILTIICVYFVIRNFWWAVLVTMLVNVLVNLYPVILQRHHRSRLARLKKILIKKQKS